MKRDLYFHTEKGQKHLIELTSTHPTTKLAIILGTDSNDLRIDQIYKYLIMNSIKINKSQILIPSYSHRGKYSGDRLVRPPNIIIFVHIQITSL
uniref:Putative ovule protein n=1 Tax=Solanum chacoense TaxID=4108 RepID=A0A0V0HBY4_SOLCH